MSPTFLMLLALFFLLGPWLLMPRTHTRPEIHGLLRVLWWLNQGYCALWHRIDCPTLAPLPEHGPAILIANHTCGIDHLLLQAGCLWVLAFLIAQEFYNFWAIHPICRLIGCIPVRRDGHDISATRAALRALEQGRVVPIFPEGKITPKSGHSIGEGKVGVAFLALHAGVPVVPAYIRGTPATNNVWKAVITPSTARVVFGPAIDLSNVPPGPPFDRTTLAAVTTLLMDGIRRLKQRDFPHDDDHVELAAVEAV